MKMKAKYFIVFTLILLLFANACNEELLDQSNPNQYTYDKYYKTTDQLTAGTNAIYSIFLGFNLWGRMFQYFCDGRADEHAIGGGQCEIHNAQLLQGTYDNTNFTITAVWTGLYRLIHRANIVIQYGPNVTGDENIKKIRIAEAKFLRAYAYYYLVVNWGRVPIYTSVVESPSDAKPLAEESEIYALIENDLKAIENDLPWKWEGNDAGRASRAAVKLLLARTLMHQGKYSDAYKELLDIYKSGKYKLVDNYFDNFMEETEYNEESIFEIGFAGNGFNWTPDGNSTNARSNVMFQDYSPVAWRNYIPSDKLLDEFERPYKGDPKEDPRLRATVYFTGDQFGDPSNPKTLTDDMQNGYTSTFNGTTIKASWKKYSPMYKLDPGGYYTSNINYRNMRFAEVLIKMAECKNELGQRDSAIYYLNLIRKRPSVNMEEYPTTRYPCDSYDQVMRAIMHEGMVEFANEKLRVLDLARWRKNNKFSTLNPDPIDYIRQDPSKALLPIPLREKSSNFNIQ